MKSITRIFNLENPQQAREFLDGLHFDGKKVTQITVESGKEIKFSDMTDDQAVHYARELYSWQPKKKWNVPQNDILIEKFPS